jgi:hypothetical protein
MALISESVAPTDAFQDPWTEPKEFAADCKKRPILLVPIANALPELAVPNRFQACTSYARFG